MLQKLLLPLFILAALPGESVVLPNYYEDYDDTTSMRGSHELTHDTVNGLHYAEVFGVNDTRDYLKYTAPYTRSVLLDIYATDGCIARVDVYVSGVDMVNPVLTYTSEVTTYGPEHTVFVYQGHAAYFVITCSGNCWWEAHLDTNPGTSPFTYVSYEKFYGYNMPYYGIPSIYYAYDPSCNVLVEGQNYTYSDVMDEAIAIWESIGNIDFVYSTTNAYFTCKIDSNVVDISVVHSRYALSNNYFTSDLRMTNDMSIYESVIDGEITRYGQPPTIWHAILGHAVVAFGLAAGVALNSTNSNWNNMMVGPFWWYDHLGDGDIGSLIALWGDANAV